jgi:hypothetical protein
MKLIFSIVGLKQSLNFKIGWDDVIRRNGQKVMFHTQNKFNLLQAVRKESLEIFNY